MDAEITNNRELTRYEVRVDGGLAGFAEYRLRPGGRVVFTHTEVDPAFEGRGVGGVLARGALDAVRADGGTAVPLCPFIKRYIDRHPEYADLVGD